MISLENEVSVWNALQETMVKHLEGFATTVEEDAQILEGELDWPSRCVIMYRKFEKMTANSLIDTSKRMIELIEQISALPAN